MQACEENEEHKLDLNSALTLKSDRYGTEEACLRSSHENSMYNMCIKVFWTDPNILFSWYVG